MLRIEPSAAPSDANTNQLDDLLAEVRVLRHRVDKLELATHREIAPSNGPSMVGRLRIGERAHLMKSTIARHGGISAIARKAQSILVREGARGILRRLRAEVALIESNDSFADYEHSSAQYVNEAVLRRASVLGSPWHVGLIRSRTADPNREDLSPITISVVTHNSEHWLHGFLNSLTEQSYPLSLISLICADNESTDRTVSFLKDFQARHDIAFRSIQIIERKNDGFGAGHNEAISNAVTDLVLVTNVDLHFGSSSILRAVLAAQADTAEAASWELSQTPYEHPKYYDPVTLETPWSAHACVLFRRSAFASVGGYDDHIFLYGEDVELSYRLRSAGHLLRYLPWVQVTHFVELGDEITRPRQLGGSLAASVLLRYRYSTPAAAMAAERQLLRLARQETDPGRRASFAEAISMIRRERDHFKRNRRPSEPVTFPFMGFDYIIQRDGHDLQVPRLGGFDTLPMASIVTRTHGPELALLREAICTVLNQTYPIVEHIIVEDRGDFAREEVRSIAEIYGSSLRYLCSPGGGRSAAGNAGMAAAEGQILFFLDSDDLLFSDHVATLVAPLIADPDLIAAYSLAWEVQILPRVGAPGYFEFMHTLHPQFRLRFSRARLKRMNFIPIQALAFRKKLFDEAGGFDEDLEALEDWTLWNSYARFGNFELIPRLTSLYHTPYDPEARAMRQTVLDTAYEPVKARITERYG